MLAAAHFGYRYWHEWRELGTDERALLVAAYRTERQIESLMAWEAAKTPRM